MLQSIQTALLAHHNPAGLLAHIVGVSLFAAIGITIAIGVVLETMRHNRRRSRYSRRSYR
jgi:hypothetical protein